MCTGDGGSRGGTREWAAIVAALAAAVGDGWRAGVEPHDCAYPGATPVGERRRSSDAKAATAVA